MNLFRAFFVEYKTKKYVRFSIQKFDSDIEFVELDRMGRIRYNLDNKGAANLLSARTDDRDIRDAQVEKERQAPEHIMEVSYGY